MEAPHFVEGDTTQKRNELRGYPQRGRKRGRAIPLAHPQPKEQSKGEGLFLEERPMIPRGPRKRLFLQRKILFQQQDLWKVKLGSWAISASLLEWNFSFLCHCVRGFFFSERGKL